MDFTDQIRKFVARKQLDLDLWDKQIGGYVRFIKLYDILNERQRLKEIGAVQSFSQNVCFWGTF